jgi:hypothetical protein
LWRLHDYVMGRCKAEHVSTTHLVLLLPARALFRERETRAGSSLHVTTC